MKTISKDQLKEKLGSPNLTVVNVLAPESYDRIHIKGSISVPKSKLMAGEWQQLNRNEEIVVHCSSYTCDASREAANFLEEKGFNVSAYEGGMKEWAEADFPTEGKVSPELYLAEYGKPPAMTTPAA